MPVKVEQLPGEPILVVTYTGHMDVETVSMAFSESTVLAEQVDGVVYRISDVRLGEGDFGDVLKIIAEIRKGIPGSTADPKFKGVFVGGHQMVRLYADILKQEQFGATTIPFFKTMEEALDYIRLDRDSV
ncbi:MAG: hypothetical protein ABI690_04530 [Chloroflexota bacterium]